MTLAIIDFNRTVYDPDRDALCPGAAQMLRGLRDKGVLLVLLSRNEGGREDALERLGVKQLFSELVFVPDKTADVIRDIMSRHGASAGDTYVVGDYLYQDVRAGNQAGVCTIQYKQGAFAGHEPQIPDDRPDIVVTTLIDVLEHVR